MAESRQPQLPPIEWRVQAHLGQGFVGPSSPGYTSIRLAQAPQQANSTGDAISLTMRSLAPWMSLQSLREVRSIYLTPSGTTASAALVNVYFSENPRANVTKDSLL